MELTGIRQCPFCELRFPNRNLLEAHLRDDHPNRVDVDRHFGRAATTTARANVNRGHTWG